MKLIISILLFLVASLLKWVLTPFSFIYGICRAAYKKELHKYLKNLAIAKDQYGNALCKHLLDDYLRTHRGYPFGNIDECISSAIGKNKVANTLTPLGNAIDRLLYQFEEDHSIKSIDLTEGNEL